MRGINGAPGGGGHIPLPLYVQAWQTSPPGRLMFRGGCTGPPSLPLSSNILIDSLIRIHGQMTAPAVCFSIPSIGGQKHDKPRTDRAPTANKRWHGRFVNYPLGEELSTCAIWWAASAETWMGLQLIHTHTHTHTKELNSRDNFISCV